MVANRSSRALALLLALPSAAFALGLGDIHVMSSLNAPLDAEIEITDVAPDEINTVQAQLAPRDLFAQNGLDYPNYLQTVQLKTVRTPDGREIIKLKSNDPISDPFITLLVQVNWSHGQLVREYTMLLDPPLYTPVQNAAASAAVAAPATGSGERSGSITRSAEAPAPAPATPSASAPPPAAEATAAPETPSATPASSNTPESAPSGSAAATASTAPSGSAARAASPEEAGGSTHTVHRGETLSRIAAGVAGEKISTPRARSYMVAIYRANPRAFDQNMNLLRSGSVLRIPDAAQAAAVSATDASAEIHRQYAAWHATEGAVGGTAAPTGESSTAAQPGHLRLVTPTEPAGAGTATAAASGAEVTQLEGRVHDLEGQLAESRRLLDLRNADLARLQAQLAAKQAAPTPATPTAPPAEAAQPPAAPPKAAEQQPPVQPPAAQPAPPPTPVASEQPPPATPLTTAPSTVKPARAAKPAPAAAPAAGGSVLDSILDYWWALALVVLALIGVGVLRFLRTRRASEFDDSLGRLAVAGGGAAGGGVLGGGSAGRGFSLGGERPMRAAPEEDLPAPEVLVEETGTHERPNLAASGSAQAPAAKHVTADDTISSETAINLDQGDPLAEADFHMAYGLYDQAADLIRIAIGREPARRDLKLKLLEVFFVWGNKEQFLQTAHELAQTRADAAPGEWEKILIMGKQLAPEDSLFTGGGAISGATAGGVDLNLEGGQSRVDFDLLGEPLPSDVPQGVDLDIGSAVGEADPTAQTTEGTTNVTDRNVALLESGLAEGAAATGATRQMTARMRRQAESTTDAEGPTVEQPQLAGRDSSPTVRKKVETALHHQSGADQTAELAIDDLGLDLGSVETAEQPGLATPEGPTLVAGLDAQSRKNLEETAEQAGHLRTSTTGQWQFESEDLTRAGALQDGGQTSQLAALRDSQVDVDLSNEATGTHPARPALDLDVGSSEATGTHAVGNGLDLDVGTATVPDAAFAATQRLASEELALPDLEPVTMSEVGTKLDLARAYMDMGDPDGARNILEEVLSEGSAAQKQEAQRLMESLPG